MKTKLTKEEFDSFKQKWIKELFILYQLKILALFRRRFKKARSKNLVNYLHPLYTNDYYYDLLK